VETEVREESLAVMNFNTVTWSGAFETERSNPNEPIVNASQQYLPR
jgi:hypothetical protein